MINKEDLVNGKEYWYSYIEFSKSSTRVNIRKIPIKVTFELSEDNSYNKSRYGVFKDEYNRHICYAYINSDYVAYVYETEEEAIEGYNSLLYNQLDKIKSEYEKKEQIIKRNFLKKKD